jgi:hypothetical protein
VVAQPPTPGPATEGQPHAAPVARAAPVRPLTGAATATAAVVRRVLTVVSEAEEPDEPEHEETKVEDAESDHEDPPLQAHLNTMLPRRASSNAPYGAPTGYGAWKAPITSVPRAGMPAELYL